MPTLVIPKRFNGPPESGHGGYSTGAIALQLDHDGPVAVSLRAPPPLETPLDVSPHEDGIAIHHGETFIASAAPGTFTLDPPGPLDTRTAARAALEGEDILGEHPFPTCFGCGPARKPGDGLRLFAGPLADHEGPFACTWTPGADELDPVFVWAALDCPSGAPVGAGASGKAILLARFTVDVERPVQPGTTYAIVSRLTGNEGRKFTSAVGLYADDGTRHARGEALWIAPK